MFARVFVAFAFLTASTTWAAAYLDPGTGSFVLQMLVAGLLTVSVSIKVFWARLTAFFRREPKAENEPRSERDA